ncbi:MAG TPA: D-glucuronyl C5-epimerase family protein [Gemmatimonadales bacterium]|nr:D-glucuronyl C5-epimerase family protein [Gemmatimonadales bacterium]
MLGFRFDYPIDAIPAAGPKASLHYYIRSDRLFFDAMELDAEGIPVQRSRTLRTYNPAYVAWYGLTSLERWLQGDDPAGRGILLRQVDWLEAHAVERHDQAIVWPLTFDWQEGACSLKAPWISAMVQGLVISSLVRAHRITDEPRLLDLCARATRVFETDIEHGGVRTAEGEGTMYEEYPGLPLPRVLDGFLFSLLGLYDLWMETDDAHVFDLFTSGIAGLRHALPSWDYRGKWSWYGSHGYLCPPQYNSLNSALLTTLARLSGEVMLRDYAAAWAPTHRSGLSRAEVFLVFQCTKNRSRLRHFLRTRGVAKPEVQQECNIQRPATEAEPLRRA